jgi:nicotinamide phosphoribosyltransferase
MSEKQYVLNMIEQFAKPGATFAMVADSYNIYDFCTMVGSDPDIKSAIDSHCATGGFVVIRPDSGDPVAVVPKMLRILAEKFGTTTNSKGYKVINNVRIIWGDGINNVSLSSILRCVVDVAGFSADNIAFGMGGGLLQQCDRDTLKFAMKCSSIGIREHTGLREDGLLGELVWRDVFKDPITDQGKVSLKGRVTLYKTEDGKEYFTGVEDWRKDEMETYYENGEQVFTQTFDQVRANSMII